MVSFQLKLHVQVSNLALSRWFFTSQIWRCSLLNWPSIGFACPSGNQTWQSQIPLWVEVLIGKSPINDKWSILQCHVWLPEGIPLFKRIHLFSSSFLSKCHGVRYLTGRRELGNSQCFRVLKLDGYHSGAPSKMRFGSFWPSDTCR